MTSLSRLGLVIVTPIYEDLLASSRLFKELAAAGKADAYIVAVDDGSIRHPVPITSLTGAGLEGVVIKLKRNVGHQRAIAIGLSYVADNLAASRVVVMDSDGEDLPSSIAELNTALESRGVDIAVAARKSRVETLRFRAFYVIYRWLFYALTGRSIRFGNFMIMKPEAIARLVSMQEIWIHVAGCVLTSKLRILPVPVDRGPRYAGDSKMDFMGLVLHGFKALMVFAEDVLVRVGVVCAGVAILSIVGFFAATILKIIGFATPGWFSVALGIMLLVFMQTGTLTLMTLMLTGVVKSGSMTTISYNDFIDTVTHAEITGKN